MKTIQERAADYAGKAWSNIEDFNEDHVTFENIATEAFVAGAQSEREELLRWRDPNVELPKDGEEVLVKADCPYCRYDVMKHDAFGWWEKTSLAGGGWYKAEVEITGWRPIQEE